MDELINKQTATTIPPVMPKEKEQHGRTFQEIVVEYPSNSTYPEYKGKPYFSIKYTENGQEFIGYGTFKPEVLSELLKEYFMPYAQPVNDDLIQKIEEGIKATTPTDEYMVGMRNGMKWCKSLLDGKEPEYDIVQPTITHEQAIDYLQETGWLQEHDRILTESKVPLKGVWKDFTDEGYVECPFCKSATNCESKEEIDDLHFCFSCGAMLKRGDSDAAD